MDQVTRSSSRNACPAASCPDASGPPPQSGQGSRGRGSTGLGPIDGPRKCAGRCRTAYTRRTRTSTSSPTGSATGNVRNCRGWPGPVNTIAVATRFIRALPADAAARKACEPHPARQQHRRRQNGRHPDGREEERQNVLAAKGVPGEHDGNQAEVAEGVGQVHEVTDVAPIARHGDQPLEDRRVDGHVGQVQPQSRQHHEREPTRKPSCQPPAARTDSTRPASATPRPCGTRGGCRG